MARGVYLGLGSNLGDREANLCAVQAALEPEVHVLRTSPIFETDPWGFAEQPSFLNQVLEVETALLPGKLLKKLKAVEAELGRVASFRFGPRVIDLDILLYGEQTLNDDGLEIPHPRIAERAFVLAPLAALAPELRHPISGLRMVELLERVDKTGIHLFNPGKRNLGKVPLTFTAVLELMGNGMGITLPFKVEKLFGKKGRTAVRGTLNGFVFASSIFPAGDGSHYLLINKVLQCGGKVGIGDLAWFTLSEDLPSQRVEIPADIKDALAQQNGASDAFSMLSNSHQQKWLDWINEIKHPETRIRRISKAINEIQKKG